MRAHVSFVAGLLAVLVAASAAHAAVTQETILMDDNRLLYRGVAVTDATLAELRALGVDRVRVSVHWANLAPRARAPARPDDPAAYDPGVFDAHDHLVRQAAREGLGVLFNITGGAPRWAAGRARGRFVNRSFAPDPRAFHHFARMIGRRYDGTYPDENQGGRPLPRVSAWSVWNEPNHGAFLQPQWTRDAQRRWRPASPARYRRLARAGLSGLAASGHTTPSDILLLGETSPLGNGSRRGRTQTIAPAAFLRELLCLDRRLRPLRGARARRAGCDFARRGELAVNAYAHHAYSIVSPPATSRRNRDEVSLADVRRLYRILDAAARAGHLHARLPVWVTEYGWQTPPDPFRGVDPVDGARWWSQAERQTRADPRVGALTQFLLLDDEPDRARRAGSKPFWRTWQSGLRYANGTPSPSMTPFACRWWCPRAPQRAGPSPCGGWSALRPTGSGACRPPCACSSARRDRRRGRRPVGSRCPRPPASSPPGPQAPVRAPGATCGPSPRRPRRPRASGCCARGRHRRRRPRTPRRLSTRAERAGASRAVGSWAMQPQRLSASELVALGGSALVAVGLFLPWYSPNDNPYANSQGRAEGPGDPSGPISLAPGFCMALVGALAMIGGSVLRSAKSGRRRRPPGVL